MNLDPVRISGARRIVVNGEVWQYKIGRSYVHIWTPRGRKLIKRAHEVAGRTPDVLERGQWKKTSDGMITPADVERFVLLQKDT